MLWPIATAAASQLELKATIVLKLRALCVDDSSKGVIPVIIQMNFTTETGHYSVYNEALIIMRPLGVT